MRRSKRLILSLAVMFIMLPAVADAITFQFPHPNMEDGGSGYDWLSPRTRTDGGIDCHLADDYGLPVGTQIYAPADGIVRYARSHGKCDASKGEYNWVYLIVIEHTLEDGSKVNSILGHVKPKSCVKEGKSIFSTCGQGNPVGEVVSYCTGDHIHFGIYKGDYGASTGVYSTKVKGYDGVCSGSNTPSGDTYEYMNYLDPYTFIFDHSIGYTSTGSNDQTIAFQNTYVEQGVDKDYPYPNSYVQDEYGTQTQHLCASNVGIGGTCPKGEDALLLWNSSTKATSLLKKGFLGLWYQIRDTIGIPTGSEGDCKTADSCQHFNKGGMEWYGSSKKKIILALLDTGEVKGYCWNGSSFTQTSSSSCTLEAQMTGSVVTSTTIADHYLWGAPYTGPTYNPDITYFLKGGKVYDVEVTVEGDVYALTNQIASGSGYVNGYLYLSHDQGLSWELIDSPIDHFSVYPHYPHTLVVGKNGTHYLVEGDTYTSIGSCTKDCRIAFWTSNEYFMARDGYGAEPVTLNSLTSTSYQGGWGSGAQIYPTNSTIFSGGRNLGDFGYSYGPGTWYRIITNIEGTADVAEVPTDTNSFYVLAETGEVWKVSASSRSASYKGRVPFSYRNDHGQILYPATSISVNPKNSSILYATVSGVGGLWRSTNSGSSWTLVVSLNEAKDCAVSQDGSLVYIANAEGGNDSGITIYEEPSVPLP